MICCVIDDDDGYDEEEYIGIISAAAHAFILVIDGQLR